MEDERCKHKGLNSGVLVLETRQDTGARVCVCAVCLCVEEEHKVTETATGEEKGERTTKQKSSRARGVQHDLTDGTAVFSVEVSLCR